VGSSREKFGQGDEDWNTLPRCWRKRRVVQLHNVRGGRGVEWSGLSSGRNRLCSGSARKHHEEKAELRWERRHGVDD
jgi:hypothetical protein